MFVLQLEQYMEHSGCDWIDKNILIISESKEKLEYLSKLLTSESQEFVEKCNLIRYTRNKSNDEKRSAILELHKSYENIYKYQIFCEIGNGENTLEILEIEMI